MCIVNNLKITHSERQRKRLHYFSIMATFHFLSDKLSAIEIVLIVLGCVGAFVILVILLSICYCYYMNARLGGQRPIKPNTYPNQPVNMYNNYVFSGYYGQQFTQPAQEYPRRWKTQKMNSPNYGPEQNIYGYSRY